MGYYIQTDMNKNKALSLVTEYNGRLIDQPRNFEEIPADKALIVVVENPTFDAAALAYSESEFRAFTNPSDTRRKRFVLLDWELAHKLAGYK